MHAVRVEPPEDPLDARIAALAARQHGLVARAQLLSLGASRSGIEHRLRNGRLHPLHRGVYAVGHPLVSQSGRWLAAVLAAGPGAALSHRSAAALWGMRPHAGRTEVTTPRKRSGRRDIHLHFAPLPADETTTRDGIPVTEPARTVLDLAAVAPRSHVERAFAEAEGQRLTSRVPLPVLLERYPRKPGRPVIRAVLAEASRGADIPKEAFVAAFLSLLDRHGLPRPTLGALLWAAGRPRECDCVWPAQRVMAELDGRAFHARSAAFESDRARDRAFTAQGWRVVRVTWAQLRDDPGGIARDLAALLGG